MKNVANATAQQFIQETCGSEVDDLLAEFFEDTTWDIPEDSEIEVRHGQLGYRPPWGGFNLLVNVESMLENADFDEFIRTHTSFEMWLTDGDGF